MANLSITAANVAQVDGGVFDGTAGETITAGCVVYLKSSDNRLWLALANTPAVPALAAVKGIALHGASAGQPLRIQTSGQITIGATVVVAAVYVLSATAGLICPTADITTTGYYRSVLGVATSTTIITLALNNSGAALP